MEERPPLRRRPAPHDVEAGGEHGPSLRYGAPHLEPSTDSPPPATADTGDQAERATSPLPPVHPSVASLMLTTIHEVHRDVHDLDRELTRYGQRVRLLADLMDLAELLLDRPDDIARAVTQIARTLGDGHSDDDEIRRPGAEHSPHQYSTGASPAPAEPEHKTTTPPPSLAALVQLVSSPGVQQLLAQLKGADS